MADPASHPSVLACRSKMRHRTQSKALVSAARCAGRNGAKALHVYRCPHCNGWHLTSQERTRGG